MNRAATALLAATAAMALPAAAQAQDQYILPPPPPPVMNHAGADHAAAAPVYADHAYSGQGYASPVPYPVEVQPQGYYPPPAPYPAPYPAQPHVQGHYAQSGLPPVPTVGYTRQERDQWLRECREAYNGARRKGTGIIGGLAGAVGGAVLGRELTDGSDTRRLGGTLIGAGVGGLVGLALGAAIGGAFDKKKADECEGYLDRYQGAGYLPGPPAGYGQGWQQSYGYGYGYHGYTTVMVPVQVGGGYTYSAPIRTENRYVIEDVVEEVVHTPRRTKYVKRAPATKYVPDKRVHYAK